MPVSGYSTPSTHPALQTGSRAARADDFWSDSSLAPSRSAVKNHRRTIAQLRPGATLTLGRAFLRLQRSPTLRSCLGFAPQPLLIPPLQHRRGGRAAAARVRQQRCGSGSSRCRTSPKAPPQTPTTGFRTGAGVRPPCPCRTLNLGALTLGAPALAQAQALPPEYVSIVYCTPTEWTPGARALRERRAPRARTTTSWCRARAIGLGCSPPPATAGGPHQGAHPRRADRPRRALRGARAGWHVGTTPAFRLSAPSTGLHQRPSSLARGGGVGVS